MEEETEKLFNEMLQEFASITKKSPLAYRWIGHVFYKGLYTKERQGDLLFLVRQILADSKGGIFLQNE